MGGKGSKESKDKKAKTKKSKTKAAEHILLGSTNDGIVVKINGLQDFPDVENSEGTPYVKVRVVPTDVGIKATRKQQIGYNFRTTPRRATCDPVFNEYFFFPISTELQSKSELHLNIFEKDMLSKDDFIAGSTVVLSSVTPNEPHVTQIELNPKLKHKNKDSFTDVKASVQLCMDDPKLFTDGHRTVHLFIIRHGESVWNEAQRDKDVGDMLSFDHPLNKTGIQQAVDFRERWMKARDDADLSEAETKLTQKFLSAKVVTSPLTRASQTCLIGLQGHPGLARPNKVEFVRSLRENKSHGGIDCVGKCIGDDVINRIRDLTTQEASAELATAILDVDVDASDVQSIWWTEVFAKDSKQQQQQQHMELLYRARYDEAESIIAVGHSHWFRGFCNFLEAGSRDTDCVFGEGLTAETFSSQKLDNSSCMSLEINIDTNSGRAKLMRADLVYGSRLQVE